MAGLFILTNDEVAENEEQGRVGLCIANTITLAIRSPDEGKAHLSKYLF